MVDKALLLGINDYEWISDLRGCENDVHNFAHLLTENFSFNSSNIRQHVSREVTKSVVSDGFNWLLDDASPGDRLVFHFSGHGSYIESIDDDEPIDELICLYDMDIDDPDTYLLDDDLARFVTRIPTGVFLTVILDACHSGTGTRKASSSRRGPKTQLLITKDTAIHIAGDNYRDVERKLKQGDSTLIKDLERDRTETVYARVFERSERLQRKKKHSSVHKFGECLSQPRTTSLNHQLLAAATEDQTAADAYISGDFHGVFSYYLCQSARMLGAQATTEQVMNRAIKTIHEAGYSQIPQNEGPYLREPLFGRFSKDENELSNFINPGDFLKQGNNQNMSNEQLLAQFLRVSEKYIDLANRLLEKDTQRFSGLRASNMHIVYVHGISQHENGFSNPWWNSMQPHLDNPNLFIRHEVLWSPVVNPRGRSTQDRQLPSEASDFAKSVEMILKDRHKQLQFRIPDNTRSVAPDTEVTVRGSGLAIDDFARYMTNEDEREQILNIFHLRVQPLLETGEKINIICHSWGSVVAWEGLRRLDSLSLSGKVENLFLVGSALSIGPVQDNLFGRITDGRRPDSVSRIYNLDASGDIVGGRISNQFSVDSEFLELDPVGCRKIPFTNIAINPGCAHGSYFNSDNHQTNKEIFAQMLNG